MAKKIYDGRPKDEALALRMKKDDVSGSVKIIVRSRDTVYGNGNYELATLAVFDDQGAMLAHYQTRSDGKIKGSTRGSVNFGWMAPKEGQYRLASDDDIALIVKR